MLVCSAWTCGPQQAFDELLAQARRVTTGRTQTQGTSRSPTSSGPWRRARPGHSPLFEVMFNLVPVAEPPADPEARPDGDLPGRG
ncbi:hypothetical protein LV779_34370 [Streptomyces thinghirensis]|nr:hypothetical protein [Streptomyces thinghirensis]